MMLSSKSATMSLINMVSSTMLYLQVTASMVRLPHSFVSELCSQHFYNLKGFSFQHSLWNMLTSRLCLVAKSKFLNVDFISYLDSLMLVQSTSD